MSIDSLHRELEVSLKTNLSGEVRFDPLSRILYSTDASNYQIEPVGVVLPRTVDDVIKAIEIASQFEVPILPRGGGTSLAGQAVGHALIIDFSKYLNNIISIDKETSTVRVQPGIYLEQLNKALENDSLMFGPDPSTARVATVGGVIGNNATGAHSIMYGMAGDNLIAAQVVLSDGSYLELSPLDDEGFNNKTRKGDSEGRLYSSLLEMRRQHGRAINDEFPKHWRRASGYSLPYLLNKPFNPARLLASSEGTLAVATEFSLSLVPRPAHTGLVLLQFEDLIASMEAVPFILEHNPSAIELIGKMLIDLTRKHRGYAPLLSFIDGEPSSILAVEFYGKAEQELEIRSHDLINDLKNHKIKASISTAFSRESQSNVWTVRRAGLGLLMSRKGDYKPLPCIEDVSVPVENLAGYVRDILDIIGRIGTEAGFYGHASAGCLHVRPLLNLKTIEGITQMKELTEEALRLALRYGGIMSGEHGDGLQRAYLNERLFGPSIYRAMCDLKAAFDPKGLLNPGKVVNAPLPTENLRLGENYKERELKTYLDWSSDGGFSDAVEMCNGQALCRKLDDDIMCPSYMATRDEVDTTRARANALRAVISGRLPLQSLTSPDMHRVFDLCLGCKGCKRECPSSVDVAKMKIEFLAHYNSSHGITLRDRLFGYIHEISQFSSILSPITSTLFESDFSRWILNGIGISRKRSLPIMSKKPFTKWFYERRKDNKHPCKGNVVYFHDTWVSYYLPQIGQAAVELLEAAGYDVILEPNRVCCGRPLLSKGMIEPARARAASNVRLLARYASQGIPIIGTEPSCILSFRDEYLDLLPGNMDARMLAENSFLLEEFLNYKKKDQGLNISWKASGPKVLFHGHCHQRALSGVEPSLDMLRVAGCSVSDSGSGCCGMAGSFGYEKEHYEISRIIGEDRLFPRVRNSSFETVIAVSGISCLYQIEHFTGKKPRHISEVLADQIENVSEQS